MKHRAPVAALVLAAASALLGAPAGSQAGPEGAPAPDLELTTVETLDTPIAMAARAGTDDLYVAERDGVVRRLVVDGGDVTASPIPVVNISNFTTAAGERGLLGLAFNPAGTKLYLHHTNNAGDTRLIEFRMNANGTRAIGSSRRLVLALRQPFPNHNGGTVTFGPDGRLYLALGDGGSGGDPRNLAQNKNRLLGKVLRINPNRAGNRAYTVPGQNPFAGPVPGAGEVWLYGVRNPWRIAHDPATGDLYVADVGQSAAEEVTVLPADGNGRNAGRGSNLGWRRMEGTGLFTGSTPPGNHTPPQFTYPHGEGCRSITGGHVYRGDAVPDLDGWYLYGDFCTGTIGALEVVDGVLAGQHANVLQVPAFNLYSFGQDRDGEVYVLLKNGEIGRIDPA